MTVSLVCSPEKLSVSVADQGIGIAPDDLPRIFDRFYRADHSRTRATGGSGLGLTIARSIARLHGGDITAASEPGQGATLTIWFPRSQPAETLEST